MRAVRELIAGLVILTLIRPALADRVRLSLIDGDAREVEITSIRGGEMQGTEGLLLDDLARLERPDAKSDPPEVLAAIVELRAGRLMAKKIRIADEKAHVEWLAGQTAALPLDSIAAIRFDRAAASTEFTAARKQPNAELDRVFVRDDSGAVTAVTGLIESLDEEQLTLDIAGQTRQVPRERLYGLIIAQPAAGEKALPLAVHLADDSIVTGESLTLENGQTRLSVLQAGELTFPWASVVRIDVRSSRVQYLSELKPVAEEQTPIVTLALPAQRDRSASGGPLMAGDRTYEKGIGVHSRSLLTFEAGGKWDRLAATIGLDPERGAKGDCVFKVVADGEEIFSQRARGGDSPVSLSLEISGRRQVTLLVEPGAGLDLGDHANWCDARFIKDK